MSNNTNTGLGLLAGIATGAILGILYAPDKGSVTRRLVKEKANEASHKLANEAVHIKETIAGEAGTLKSKVLSEATTLRNSFADTLSTKKQSLDEQLETVVTNASFKADDVITTLEKKLSMLKEQNKKLQKKNLIA